MQQGLRGATRLQVLLPGAVVAMAGSKVTFVYRCTASVNSMRINQTCPAA
jgi:hypothetical protein